MKRLALTYLFILIATPCMFAQNRTPKFRDFRVGAKFSGRNAKPVLDKDSQAFRTRITNAARHKPNFAGEFVLTGWGCGTECVGGAVVSVRTGKVSMLPFTVCCWTRSDDEKPVDFRLESRLIIFSGRRNESENDASNDLHFYEFRDGHFRHLKTLRRPD